MGPENTEIKHTGPALQGLTAEWEGRTAASPDQGKVSGGVNRVKIPKDREFSQEQKARKTCQAGCAKRAKT